MLWLVLTIAVWGAVHSWLASLGVKGYVRRSFGEWAGRLYRLAYNVFSVISFAPILLLMVTLPDKPLYAVHGLWLYGMLAGQAAAFVGLLIGVLQTGPASFIGLTQVLQGEAAPHLVTTGLYRWVRHPLYLFGLLLLWLTPRLTVNTLIAYAALTLYLLVGAYFEERKLLKEFGAAYADYRSRTPMILPFLAPRLFQSGRGDA